MAASTDITQGNLVRLGFFEPARARAILDDLGEVARPLVAPIGRSADPDLALASLVAIADVVEDRDQLLQ